jgi:Mg2+ and Co2+ transporter CorA
MKSPQKTAESVTNMGLEWINIEDPTRESVGEITRLGYHFHELNIEDSLSKIQIPKIDRHKDYIFVLLHFPTSNKGHDSRSHSNPLLNSRLSSSIPALLSRARRLRRSQKKREDCE